MITYASRVDSVSDARAIDTGGPGFDAPCPFAIDAGVFREGIASAPENLFLMVSVD